MHNGQPPLTPEMEEKMDELRAIVANPVVESAYNDAVANVQPYIDEIGYVGKNPWAGTSVAHFVDYFENWFTWVPSPTSGLGKIVPFTFFYLGNRKAFYFLNELMSRRDGTSKHTKEIFNWTVDFVVMHGQFMDTEASTYTIDAWKKAMGKSLEAYKPPPGGRYTSFNQFFTRELKDPSESRPIAAADDDSVLVAPADSTINFIQTELTLDTDLQVKTRQISVRELLAESDYAEHFVGGTAVSCVLMPNSYHRYHAPVTGKIVESRDVPGIYNGILDGDHWFNQGNIGESTTDFSIFEDFHRAYFIIETKDFGYVAMIPVGLNTISALYPSMVHNRSTYVPKGDPPVPVCKGTELGHFAYGGSLNILLFEPGVFDSVSLLMGQRLGSLAARSEPSTGS